MDYLKFRSFEWDTHPEEFLLRMETSPVYTVTEEGVREYEGMSPAARIVEMRGVFLGEDAQARFQQLMELLAERTPGELVHPVWGSFNMLLTKVELGQDSGPGCVAYKAVFEETDVDGNPVKLPDLPVIVIPGMGNTTQ